MSSENAPVILVDDRGETNGLLDQFQMAIDDRWPDRPLFFYSTLRDAAEIVRSNSQFVLILDHNMDAGRDPELASELGVDPDTTLFGYHLCSALRRQHTFGLAIPVAYLTGALPGDLEPNRPGLSFLRLLQSEGPFLPNFWVDKNRDWSPEGLISDLDDYADLATANLRDAANAVFLTDIPELDTEELV